MPPGSGRRDAKRANALKQAAQTLLAAKEELDALDAKVGDGDAGSTFAQGAAAVLAALEADALSTGEQARLAQELAALIEHSMGGSSGVLLSIMLTAAAQALAESASWPDALERGTRPHAGDRRRPPGRSHHARRPHPRRRRAARTARRPASRRGCGP